jgi:hypothetical protein
MSLLVRSWNVHHGMTSPHTRRNYLEQAVRLIASDRPDVVCLQEVPLWGRRRLEGWSDMRLVWNSTRRVWFPPGLGGWITRLNQGFFRSAVSGQANAILLDRRLEPLEQRWTTISRDRRERRICQAVRLSGMVVANLHASGVAGQPEVGAAENSPLPSRCAGQETSSSSPATSTCARSSCPICRASRRRARASITSSSAAPRRAHQMSGRSRTGRSRQASSPTMRP